MNEKSAKLDIPHAKRARALNNKRSSNKVDLAVKFSHRTTTETGWKFERVRAARKQNRDGMRHFFNYSIYYVEPAGTSTDNRCFVVTSSQNEFR